MRWDYVQVALCGVNSACVSALTAGMRCLASRATLPRALEYSHFGRSQEVSSDCAAATLRRRISGPEQRAAHLLSRRRILS